MPVVLAFLLQASVYLVLGFPQVRKHIEERLPAARLALVILLLSLAPYLVYSVPTGVFSVLALAKLALLCAAVAFAFVAAPPKDGRFSPQDALVLAVLAYPMISGLSPMFREIYAGPSAEIPRLDVLGKIMLIPLGATAFLSIRRVPQSGYRFAISRGDFAAGVRNFLLFLPFGVVLALGLGVVQWGPQTFDGWTYLPELAGNMLGIYAVVALGEELYFRGILQNLLSRRMGSVWRAQLIASVLYGAAHLSTRGFPNWGHALVTAVLGWFCGRAYRQTDSVVASAVTHTLVVLTWRYLFN